VTDDAQAITQWLAVIDEISYYELFRVTPAASFDDLRAAFHAFVEDFHPDAHYWRDPGEQAAIGVVFRRGTEAYRILSDPSLRARYDEGLRAGILRPELLVLENPASTPSRTSMRARLIDQIRMPSARPFVLRAEELFKKGDLKQAKIQLVMAMHLDANNPALEAFAKELEEAMKAQKT